MFEPVRNDRLLSQKVLGLYIYIYNRWAQPSFEITSHRLEGRMIRAKGVLCLAGVRAPLEPHAPRCCSKMLHEYVPENAFVVSCTLFRFPDDIPLCKVEKVFEFKFRHPPSLFSLLSPSLAVFWRCSPVSFNLDKQGISHFYSRCSTTKDPGQIVRKGLYYYQVRVYVITMPICFQRWLLLRQERDDSERRRLENEATVVEAPSCNTIILP